MLRADASLLNLSLNFNIPDGVHTTAASDDPLMHERRINRKGHTDYNSDNLYVELTPFKDMSILRRSWLDLVSRSLECNIFYEPAFLEAAALHLPTGRNLFFITVWLHKPAQTLIESRRSEDLVGLFPIYLPKLGWIPHTIKGWSCPFSPLGTPLLDSTLARPALEACLNWLAQRGSKSVNLQFPLLERNGAFMQLLQDVCAASQREIQLDNIHKRAALMCDAHHDQASNKREHEWMRQLRRFNELGTLKTRHVFETREIRDALEHFLALEASGWKGRERSSLLQDTATASFVRSFIRILSRTGYCRIDEMRLNDAVVASGIVITSGAKSWYWKTAYSETYAKYSPGVHLTKEITKRQLESETIAITDSCAVENHPMIDALWHSRIEFADVTIATRAGVPTLTATTVRMKNKGAQALRSIAKKAYHGLRNHRTSPDKK